MTVLEGVDDNNGASGKGGGGRDAAYHRDEEEEMTVRWYPAALVSDAGDGGTTPGCIPEPRTFRERDRGGRTEESPCVGSWTFTFTRSPPSGVYTPYPLSRCPSAFVGRGSTLGHKHCRFIRMLDRYLT